MAKKDAIKKSILAWEEAFKATHSGTAPTAADREAGAARSLFIEYANLKKTLSTLDGTNASLNTPANNIPNTSNASTIPYTSNPVGFAKTAAAGQTIHKKINK